MTSRKPWAKQMKTKTGRKYQLVQKAGTKPINYLMDFQQEGKLNTLLETASGVHTLDVLETNMELNGWWTLTQMSTEKCNQKEQRTANIRFAAMLAEEQYQHSSKLSMVATLYKSLNA